MPGSKPQTTFWNENQNCGSFHPIFPTIFHPWLEQFTQSFRSLCASNSTEEQSDVYDEVWEKKHFWKGRVWHAFGNTGISPASAYMFCSQTTEIIDQAIHLRWLWKLTAIAFRSMTSFYTKVSLQLIQNGKSAHLIPGPVLRLHRFSCLQECVPYFWWISKARPN